MFRKRNLFESFSHRVALLAGRPATFMIACSCVLLWIISGPLFVYSDTWQLVINTGTTIITFLMVFLIQNTQNSDTEALHLKLDELIRTTKGAHMSLLDLEEITQEDLDKFKAEYEEIARKAYKRLKNGQDDTNILPLSASAFD